MNAPKEGETVKFDILITFYDTNDTLVKLSKIDAEMSGDMDLFGVDINIPENLEIGSVKLMIWDKVDTMKPLMEAVPVR